MSVDELADYLGVSTSSIYNWRYKGQGPRAVRLAGGTGALRFRQEDVEEWLSENADQAA